MKKITFFGLAMAVFTLAGAGMSAKAQDTIQYVHKSETPQIFEEASSTDDPVVIDAGVNKGNSYVRHNYRSFAVYKDTMFTIVSTTDSVEKIEKTVRTDTVKAKHRHQLQMYIGGGWGSLNYRLANNGVVTGAPLALAEIDYAYFFHKNVGIGIGLRISNTTSVARLQGNRLWSGVTDTDGEIYDHTTLIKSWRERETMHTLDIPLSLQAQFYFNEKEKAGMYFGVGASLRINGHNRFNVKEGDIEDRAYYPATHLSLDHLHEFGDRDLKQVGRMDLRRLGAGVFGDLGFLFRVGRVTDLAVGGYFQYTVTDMSPANKTALGFGNNTFTFMPAYQSAIATTEASAAHPWEAGLKLGLRIRPGKDKVKKTEEETIRMVPVVLSDTTVTLITRKEWLKTHEKDTAFTDHRVNVIAGGVAGSGAGTADEGKTSKGKVPAGYDKGEGKRDYNTAIDFNSYKYKYHIIYFRFDSDRLTDEAVEHLNRILALLQEDENRVVVIDGHTCEMGPDAYNMRLSERRADVVADYLTEHGISEKRMLVRYHGFHEPSSDKPHPLSQDRRVVVRISISQ